MFFRPREAGWCGGAGTQDPWRIPLVLPSKGETLAPIEEGELDG